MVAPVANDHSPVRQEAESVRCPVPGLVRASVHKDIGIASAGGTGNGFDLIGINLLEIGEFRAGHCIVTHGNHYRIASERVIRNNDCEFRDGCGKDLCPDPIYCDNVLRRNFAE